MSEKHTPGRLYIRTNRHPNTDGTPWGWVDLYEPGSMRQASPDGIQVTWSRGQTSEANARRLVACWNACEMVSTEDLEALTHPADVSWAYTIDRLVRERDELLEALKRIVDWDDVGLALTQDHVVQARAAIAKAEGGAA